MKIALNVENLRRMIDTLRTADEQRRLCLVDRRVAAATGHSDDELRRAGAELGAEVRIVGTLR